MNIEEIKKEILEVFNNKHYQDMENSEYFMDDIIKILDKYNNQPYYKSDIEKEHTVLKRFIIKRGLYEALLNDDEFIEHLNIDYPTKPDYKTLYEELRFMVADDYFHRIKELEQKYNLGGE